MSKLMTVVALLVVFIIGPVTAQEVATTNQMHQKYAILFNGPKTIGVPNMVSKASCSGTTPCCCQVGTSSSQNSCVSSSDCSGFGGRCVSSGGYC
jgi:hypothetical protein